MDDDSADARVAIASFQSAAEAQQALLAVAADGIEAGVRRDSLLGGIWLTLSVSEGDVERALGIVQRLWPDEAARLPPAPQLCPRCGAAGSTQLPRILLMLVAAAILIPAGFAVGQVELFALTFLISATVLMIIPGRRCASCGERWRARREPESDDPVEVAAAPCPQCGSTETSRIDRRREKAMTLLVNMAVPPLVVVWPFLKTRECAVCGHQWR